MPSENSISQLAYCQIVRFINFYKCEIGYHSQTLTKEKWKISMSISYDYLINIPKKHLPFHLPRTQF